MITVRYSSVPLAPHAVGRADSDLGGRSIRVFGVTLQGKRGRSGTASTGFLPKFRLADGRLPQLALLLSGAVLLSGCRATTFHTHLSPEATEVPPGATLVVVPFENLSNSRNAGLVATDLAASVLLAQGYFQVMEVGEVQEDDSVRFRRLETTTWERQLGVNPVAAAAVGRSCKADCVLAGSVGEYGFVDGFGETATVGLSVRLVDSATAHVLWSGSLSRRVGAVAFSEESAHRLTHQVLADLLGFMESDLRQLNE